MKTTKKLIGMVVMSAIFITMFGVNVYAKENYKEVAIVWKQTKFDTRQYNRNNNMRLATDAINGKVLSNGEEFSFNNTVGQRTKARGYKAASIFSGNKVVQGLGGGICQVSTTLYMATKATKMQILERKIHSMPVTYAKRDEEATVSWGSIDFRWKNTSGDPLRIEMKINEKEGTLICILWQRVPK